MNEDPANEGSVTDLFAHLARTADRIPDAPAITDLASGGSLTFGTLRDESERIATFLRQHGVERYDRVGLSCPNRLAYLPAAFGILRAGGCLTPIPSGATRAEVDQLIDEIDVAHCIVANGEPFPSLPSHTAIESGPCEGFTLHRVDNVRDAPTGFAELDPAFVRFTSGSTGRSKGVVLSHAATTARVVASDARLEFSESDRVFWVLPLAYHFAVTITAYVRAGAHIQLSNERTPAGLVEAIETHRPTVLYLSPVHVERLANTASATTLESARLTVSTAAPIAPDVIARFEERCGVSLAQAYGIIEAGLPCINTRRSGEPVTSVGSTTPGYTVALFDDDGQKLAPDPEVEGEIGLRGDGLFCAYYRPWTLRRDVEHDGFFLTGDIGRFDADGNLTLVGRKKAMIFVGGMKFFPEEVEAAIATHPAVRESRVWAEEHPRLGQIPRADLVLAPGATFDAAALRRHLADRLSTYKLPTKYEVVAELPRTKSGKIRRW